MSFPGTAVSWGLGKDLEEEISAEERLSQNEYYPPTVLLKLALVQRGIQDSLDQKWDQ